MAVCELCKLEVKEVRAFGKFRTRVCRKCIDNEPSLDWYYEGEYV